VCYVQSILRCQVATVKHSANSTVNTQFCLITCALQVCVVYPDQLIPIWVHRTTLITLRVLHCSSSSSAGDAPEGAPADSAPHRLTARAEVVVSPKPRPRITPAAAATAAGHSSSAAGTRLKRSAPLRVQPWPAAGAAQRALQKQQQQQSNDSGSNWWWQPADVTTTWPPVAACHPSTLTALDGYASSSAAVVPVALPAACCSAAATATAAAGGTVVQAVLGMVWLDQQHADIAAEELAVGRNTSSSASGSEAARRAAAVVQASTE
jgi:Peroxisome biogenesis factor 1, N-terminal